MRTSREPLSVYCETPGAPSVVVSDGLRTKRLSGRVCVLWLCAYSMCLRALRACAVPCTCTTCTPHGRWNVITVYRQSQYVGLTRLQLDEIGRERDLQRQGAQQAEARAERAVELAQERVVPAYERL